MKTMNVTEMQNVNGGWTRCRICGKNVYGNWWKKYKHCLKHAANSIMPIVNFMATCFGLAGSF